MPKRIFDKTRETHLLAVIAQLRAALRPFTKIRASSLHPANGSEAEPYIVLLKDGFDNPTAFTGLDLAIAREAYNKGRTVSAIPRYVMVPVALINETIDTLQREWIESAIEAGTFTASIGKTLDPTTPAAKLCALIDRKVSVFPTWEEWMS